MKKLLTLTALFFVGNFVFSQTPKYVYCSVNSNDYKSYYVSEVADVTLLPKAGVSKIGAYGKLNLVDYYTNVAKKWFKDLLRSNGYTGISQEIYVLIMNPEINSINCASNNEDGCFILDKNYIVDRRQRSLTGKAAASNAPQFIYIK